MVIMYGIAMIVLSIQFASAFYYLEMNFESKPNSISPNRNPWISGSYSIFLHTLFQIYGTSHLISFITVWIASVLFTKSLREKVGKIKYWIIVSIPVLYFLLQYLPQLLDQAGILTPLLMAEDPIFQYIHSFIVNTINVGTGILFGISFFIIARSASHEHLKYFLAMCGGGIMIIFSSNISQVLIMATFPAWAIVSLTFILPASFLILLGLDSSTFYIAADHRVRSALGRSRKEFEVFKSLGSVEF